MSAPSDRRHHPASSGILAVWVALASCDAAARQEVAADGPKPARASTQANLTHADQLAGTYRHVGGQAERDAVLAAIEDVVGEMNIVSRSIARNRLQESNPVPSKVTIGREGETITIGFDSRSYTAPLDGSSVKVVGITGDELDYRVEVDEHRLVQHFVGPRGGRVNTFEQKGDTLTLRVEVSSKSLPKSLTYTLTMKR